MSPLTSTASGAAVSVASLRTTGVRTDVVVHRLRTAAQARWIDHVVATNLVDLDGCLPDVSARTVRRGTYRVHVDVLCAGGVAPARAAAARLAKSRPWYHVSVRTVPVVAFTFLADLPSGRGDAVGAALKHLPVGDFFYADGDDVSLTYVGQGVTQAQLNAALAAFAAELHIPTSRVAVTPIRWS